jgi:hypothetical protein
MTEYIWIINASGWLFNRRFYIKFAKLCSSRWKTVKQCVLDCILCHNIVLGGDSVVEVSAVCYSGYENVRPENVSSGVNILIN